MAIDGLIGVWWLEKRIDHAADGSRRIDPTLGPDPIGILTYAPTHFAAQFMKRDRSGTAATALGAGANNTAAVGGYDAYFGTYEINHRTGEVLHRLVAALTEANVGIEVSRTLNVEGDSLTITLATSTLEGEPVTRTLTWRRIG